MAAMVMLSACGLTPEGDAFRAGFLDALGKAMDGGVLNAEEFLCRKASIEAVRKRYGRTTEMAAHYRGICGASPSDLVTPGTGEAATRRGAR